MNIPVSKEKRLLEYEDIDFTPNPGFLSYQILNNTQCMHFMKAVTSTAGGRPSHWGNHKWIECIHGTVRKAFCSVHSVIVNPGAIMDRWKCYGLW